MCRSLYDKLHRRFGTTLPESEVAARSQALIDSYRASIAPAALQPSCARLKQTKVAIVGGGFAGMMAAWTLCHREKNLEVVLFEAGPDVGGRVSSSPTFTQGRLIEFGAELVGANHSRWLALATDLGVTLITRTAERDYRLFQLALKFRVDGKDIDSGTAERLETDMRNVFTQIGDEAGRVVNDPRSPWTQPSLSIFDHMSVADKLTKPPPLGLGLRKDKLLFRALELQLGNNLVVPLDQMNYLGLLCLVKAGQFGTKPGDDPHYLGFWDETEAYRCADGNQALVRRMAAKLTNPKEGFNFTLLPNTAINEIKIEEAKARPVTLRWHPSPAADRRNANPFDYVILATPPTVWADMLITPEHPLKTFGPLQTGPAVKFLSNLKDRFWVVERAAPSGISSDIGMIWEGTDNQTLIEGQWIELSVFAGGLSKSGRILTNSEFFENLRKLYRGYADSTRGKPKMLVDWPRKPFIKTGYSSPKLGHMFTVAERLQMPLNRDRMFLAGEHTQTDFYGFMEGALRSGERVANALIAVVCPAVRVA